MKLKQTIIAGITFVAGYFLGASNIGILEHSAHLSPDDVAKLEKKLEQATTLNVQFRDKLSAIETKKTANNKIAASVTSDEADTQIQSDSDDAVYDEQLDEGRDISIESAYKALENGNMDEATKQFNALLGQATDAAKRSEIIDGLIAIHEATYQWIMQDGNHIHGAMWQLFEMQKLRPEQMTVSRAKALSKDILSRANEYLDANNLLSGADYLNSLVHTTNMMVYDVEGVAREELVARVKNIEQQPAYQESLYQRASNNLMNGSPLEKNIVFWDFAKLAEIDSENRSSDEAFTSQFADATLVHLTNLKEMNQPGEVKSRLDYIRYVFPYLMKDERISNFY